MNDRLGAPPYQAKSENMIRLEITPGVGYSVGAVTRRVLDELHARLRAQYLEITRDDDAEISIGGGVHTFTLDPPSAGGLTVELTGETAARTIVFTLTGIAAVTLAETVRTLARQLRQGYPHIRVRLAQRGTPCSPDGGERA